MVPCHCCTIYNSAFPPAGSTFKKAILQISGKRICWNSSEENESWHAARQNSLSTGACLPNPSSKEVVSTGEPWLSIHITVNHRKKWTMKKSIQMKPCVLCAWLNSIVPNLGVLEAPKCWMLSLKTEFLHELQLQPLPENYKNIRLFFETFPAITP